MRIDPLVPEAIELREKRLDPAPVDATARRRSFVPSFSTRLFSDRPPERRYLRGNRTSVANVTSSTREPGWLNSGDETGLACPGAGPPAHLTALLGRRADSLTERGR